MTRITIISRVSFDVAGEGYPAGDILDQIAKESRSVLARYYISGNISNPSVSVNKIVPEDMDADGNVWS